MHVGLIYAYEFKNHLPNVFFQRQRRKPYENLKKQNYPKADEKKKKYPNIKHIYLKPAS